MKKGKRYFIPDSVVASITKGKEFKITKDNSGLKLVPIDMELGGFMKDTVTVPALKREGFASLIPIKLDTAYGGRGEGDWKYTIRNSIADFSEFPALAYYVDRHGVYPSSTQYDAIFNYDDFVRRVKKIKKLFYMESSSYRDDNHNQKYPSLFYLCFEDENNIVFYIGISNKKYDGNPAKLGAALFTITLLFNPAMDSKKILKLAKEKIIGLPELFLDKEQKHYLNVLIKNSNGYGLSQKEIACPKIDFALNYNSDFKEVHDLILEKLSIENSKGLVLLHGLPGSGKTTYIRYLINQLKKKVIYIPPNMVNVISEPELIKFFLEHHNSVLVIEDAENVLMKRNEHSSQAIANILNLTDGLLSDCANIQIVATFNTNIVNIDEALLRKGRLITKYEFKELSEDRVKKLSAKLGFTLTGEHVLADVYNAMDKSHVNKRTKIGFNK